MRGEARSWIRFFAFTGLIVAAVLGVFQGLAWFLRPPQPISQLYPDPKEAAALVKAAWSGSRDPYRMSEPDKVEALREAGFDDRLGLPGVNADRDFHVVLEYGRAIERSRRRAQAVTQLGALPLLLLPFVIRGGGARWHAFTAAIPLAGPFFALYWISRAVGPRALCRIDSANDSRRLDRPKRHAFR